MTLARRRLVSLHLAEDFVEAFHRLNRVLAQRFDLMQASQASRRVSWARPSQAYDEQGKFARFYSSLKNHLRRDRCVIPFGLQTCGGRGARNSRPRPSPDAFPESRRKTNGSYSAKRAAEFDVTFIVETSREFRHRSIA